MNDDSRRTVRPHSYFSLAALLVAGGMVLGLGLSASLNAIQPSTAARTGLPVVSSGPAPSSPFADVVEKTVPAVVGIEVKKKVASAEDPERSGPYDEFFRRFFGDTPRRPQRYPSTGSGFIVDTRGYVMTNNHVVRDADEITVILSDKRSYKAKVVGSDAGTDVAVIKIEARDLPALPLGDSDNLRVGDWVIAIGNPLGELPGSVTAGIVSAKGRANLNIFGGTPDFQDFIQTDASINFGNSGGPLCNIRGEAIGLNTAINPSGQGIGFAIPINLARHVADQLIAHGSVQRAWLGVTLAQLSPDLAQGLNLDTSDGVLVQSVMKDTPAERAGLRRGDVIVEFEGVKVADLQKFRLRVADTPVGRRATLVVIRDGRRVPLQVTLAERTEQVVAQANRPPQGEMQSRAGMRVRDMTPEELAEVGAKNGVLVEEVAEDSPADDAGIQANDVVEEVAGKPVTAARSLMRIIADSSARGQNVVLLVNTNGQTRFVVLKFNR